MLFVELRLVKSDYDRSLRLAPRPKAYPSAHPFTRGLPGAPVSPERREALRWELRPKHATGISTRLSTDA